MRNNLAEMAEKRENYATYAIYASANFYTSGMACRAMDKRRKGGTKVQRTEAWFFEKKIQAIEKRYKL